MGREEELIAVSSSPPEPCHAADFMQRPRQASRKALLTDAFPSSQHSREVGPFTTPFEMGKRRHSKVKKLASGHTAVSGRARIEARRWAQRGWGRVAGCVWSPMQGGHVRSGRSREAEETGLRCGKSSEMGGSAGDGPAGCAAGVWRVQISYSDTSGSSTSIMVLIVLVNRS